jgi:hypothetical protein
MDEHEIVAKFPRLALDGFELTSPVDKNYNCVGWALGVDQKWWPPGAARQLVGSWYWPNEDQSVTVEAFEVAFAERGYEPCADGELEESYEKLALYVNSSNVPRHVARQIPDGSWSSKIGEDVDIRHMTLEGLYGDDYGEVRAFMRRKLPGFHDEPADDDENRTGEQERG